MGKFQETITDSTRDFIRKQKMFFVATSPLSASGHINLSPKGMDSFRVLDNNRVAYMDIVGSGNETSAHLLENGRITIMFCSYEGAPNILRLYGKGFTVLPGDPQWAELSIHFNLVLGTRQILVADIDKVQNSCGFGIPYYSYLGERDQAEKWALKKGKEGLDAYQKENNLLSVDGLPTSLGLSIKK